MLYLDSKKDGVSRGSYKLYQKEKGLLVGCTINEWSFGSVSLGHACDFHQESFVKLRLRRSYLLAVTVRGTTRLQQPVEQ